MSFKAILFDMDGLLVDSERVWQMAEHQMMTDRGYHFTDEQRAAIVGLRVDEFMARVKEMFNLPETPQALADELNERMLALIPQEVRPMIGAAQLIAWVQQHDIPRAIVSNSSHSIINATVKAQGWDAVFSVRCSGDDETHGKPAPDVYLTGARRLGFAPSECVALEDSVNGSRAAVAAGMVCYAVPDRSHAHAGQFAAITPHVFDDLTQVLPRLQGEVAQ
jgi:mannitol-1-/sugar-/sorbitol-6-/2-deoxyglucose-6-phosphatase